MYYFISVGEFVVYVRCVELVFISEFEVWVVVGVGLWFGEWFVDEWYEVFEY